MKVEYDSSASLMKIGFQGRFLAHPYTGIGQYTHGLLREFGKQQEIHFTIPAPEKCEENFGASVHVQQVREPFLATKGVKRHYFEQHSALKFFLEQKVDLIHFPYPSHPWRPMNVPTIVTVHDVIPWIFPEYSNGILSSLAHGKAKSALHLATHIITVSEFSKKEIMRVCAIPEEKISVIYNGCSQAYEKPADASLIDQFQLQKKQYFLYVGGYDSRKNVPTLVEAFKIFASKNPDATLVLVGMPDEISFTGLTLKSYGDTMKVSSVSEKGKVVCTGFVDEKTLATLYRNCTAFVHLSKYEGFNIPLLEAAKSGAPLILSDIPVHREIAKNNALFVDSTDPPSIANAMQYPPQQISEQFRQYSWQKSADQHLSLYRTLCQLPPFSHSS